MARQQRQPVAENGTDWQAQTGDPLLVLALASGATVKDAAQQAGVSERTAWRRLDDDGFRRCVAEAKAELVTRALAKLADGASKAADTLLAVMDCQDDPRARIAAAKLVLDLAMPARQAFTAEADSLRPTRRVECSMDDRLAEFNTRDEATGPARALPVLFDGGAE